MAQQHYRKPAAMGGGGNTFDNFAVPTQLVQTANMGADVDATGVTGTGNVTIIGTMQEEAVTGTAITVTMVFNEKEIVSSTFSDL